MCAVQNYIRQPDRTWIPRGHPIIDTYFEYKDFPEEDRLPQVPTNHPDPHQAFLNGDQLPKGHPSISLQLQGIIPEGHPDINDLFLEDSSSRKLRELPSWHPDVSTLVQPRSLATSPASLLCYAVGALLIIIALARAITRWRNSKRTREVIVSKDDTDDSNSSTVDETIADTRGSWMSRILPSGRASGAQSGIEIDASNAVLVAPQQTSDSAMMFRSRDQPDNNTNEERILVYKEKKSNWKTVFGKRVIKSSHSTGEVITCVIYLLINVAALLTSPYSYSVGLGSLSVGNTLFIFLTAARNSVLSWVVGISFEQALVFHRFIGRLMVLLACIHALLHLDYITGNTSSQRTITGLISLGFGLVIVVSSLNVVRRKYFNLFFWSHIISFIGFIVGVFLHATGARPFLIASIACYGLDKCIQMVWKWPMRTTVFEKVDDRIVHCQIPKSSISSLLGTHDVGQYIFVNFPSLSLQEWHVSFQALSCCVLTRTPRSPPYLLCFVPAFLGCIGSQ